MWRIISAFFNNSPLVLYCSRSLICKIYVIRPPHKTNGNVTRKSAMLTTYVIIYHYRSTTYLFYIDTEASTHIENIIVYIFYPSAIYFPNYTCRKYNGVYFLSHRYINIIFVIILTRYKGMCVSMVQWTNRSIELARSLKHSYQPPRVC